MVTTDRDVECLVKLTFEGVSTITSIALRDYSRIMDSVPKGTRLRLLCWKGEQYRWIELEEVKVADTKSKYDVWYTTEWLQLPITGNKKKVPKIAILPEGTFNVNRTTFTSFVLAMATHRRWQQYEVRWSFDGVKENCYSLKSYLNNFKKIKDYNPKVYSDNGVLFDVNKIISNVNESIYEMVNITESSYIRDLIDLDILISDWTFAPALFSYTFTFELDKEFVPLCLNPFMYLLFGYKKEIKTRLMKKREIVDFNIKDLRFKKAKFKSVRVDLNVKLVDESWNILTMNENIPIRWEDE